MNYCFDFNISKFFILEKYFVIGFYVFIFKNGGVLIDIYFYGIKQKNVYVSVL